MKVAIHGHDAPMRAGHAYWAADSLDCPSLRSVLG
jgi:hypothetical protein